MNILLYGCLCFIFTLYSCIIYIFIYVKGVGYNLKASHRPHISNFLLTNYIYA